MWTVQLIGLSLKVNILQTENNCFLLRDAFPVLVPALPPLPDSKGMELRGP